MQSLAAITHSVILFVLTGVCEIGGGWLVWKWLRDHKPTWWGLLGGLIRRTRTLRTIGFVLLAVAGIYSLVKFMTRT